MAPELGWTEAERQRQVAAYRALVTRERDVRRRSRRQHSTRSSAHDPRPTPPIALDRRGRASPRPHIGAPPCRSVERRHARADCATRAQPSVTDVADGREASRDWWPLAMIWALDGQVPGLAAVVARPKSADEVAAVLARLQRRPGAGHRGRRPQRRVRRERAGARRRRARPVRARRASSTSTTTRSCSTCCPAPSATRSRTSCAPSTASRSGTGRSRSRSRPSAAGSPAGAPASCSTRYGKIEDMVVGLDVVLADGSDI